MMAAEAPRVSVVLPVRDGATHLEAAVASILNGTFRSLELLMVDDGSRDATPTIMERLARSDRRVRMLTGPRRGLVAALNEGLREARAPLVARMDADDVAAPDRLTRQVAVLDASPGVVLVGSAIQVIGPAGARRRLVRYPTAPNAIRAALAHANPIAHPTVVLRRDAALDAGGYRPAFDGAEDYDLWLRLAELHDLVNLPDALLNYREHAGQSVWRGLEQRLLAELGAQAAAARRRSGVPDGCDGATPVDMALLARLGVGASAIGDRLISRALGAASDGLAAGEHAAARAAVRLGLRQPGLRARTRAHLLLLGLRALRP